MQSSDRLPIRSAPENQSTNRQRTARYYARMVRESLATRVSKTLCMIFLSLLLVVGIILFILWLSLRPHKPRFHIHDFSIPSLAQRTGFENAQIRFNVTARNSNQHIGIYYYSMEGFVYYKNQRVGATPLLNSFYQEPKTTTLLSARISGATLTVYSQRWKELMNGRVLRKISLRLDIKSIIRFKVNTWDSNRQTMHANCNIDVGPDGLILPTSRDKKCPVYFT